SLTKITIPDTITKIEGVAFSDCTNLTEIEIPSNVNTIGASAFSGCSKLEKVTLNEGLTTLGENSFNGTKISSIYIPSTLKNVTNYGGPFKNCVSLNDVTFSKKPAIIPEYLFEGCTGLKEITIPGNIYKIKNNAFNDCSALEKITILNPYNGIIDDKSTIAPKASICGYDDSSAHVYAVKYERNFVSLGPIPPSYLGDVNKDETVDSTDASLILAEYALLSTNGTPTFDDDQNKRADVNADGCIDSMDASYILQYYAFVSTVGPLRSDDYFYGKFNS
ncbi:MAG: leucine-rich repeat protein, partial [Ruminococcus sp.]|nr:leucine-rich repeat protein [Ruminococcus sp.]